MEDSNGLEGSAVVNEDPGVCGRSACGQPIVSRRAADTIGRGFDEQFRGMPDGNTPGVRLSGAERTCGVADETVVRFLLRAGGVQPRRLIVAGRSRHARQIVVIGVRHRDRRQPARDEDQGGNPLLGSLACAE